MQAEFLLHEAIQSQDLIKLVRVLNSQKDLFDEWDDMVMSLAVSTGNIDIVDILIKNCYCLNHECFRGNTSPLARSIEEYKPIYFIEQLIFRGANPQEKLDAIPILTSAVQRRDLEIVELLLKYKAPVNDADESGYTPIMSAILENDIKMIELLIQNGGDLNLQTIYHESALSIALKNECIDIANLIKSYFKLTNGSFVG
jgi:ankyrin repeat protein